MELVYDYPLYRPPSEANSLIFQVTLGCSFNECSFCNMYRTKEYFERPIEEIKREIEKVTPTDIQKIAQEIFKNESLNLALIGKINDTKTLKKALKLPSVKN